MGIYKVTARRNRFGALDVVFPHLVSGKIEAQSKNDALNKIIKANEGKKIHGYPLTKDFYKFRIK